MVLLGNKCDKDKDAEKNLDRTLMDRYCTEKGFVKWFDVSAKENIEIDKAGRFLVEKILDNQLSLSDARRTNNVS